MIAATTGPRVGRRARAIAIALAGIAVLLVAVGLVSFALSAATGVPETRGWPFTVAFTLGVLTFAACGLVIAAASPGNRIGWLILVISVVGGVNFTLERAGVYLEFVRGEPLGSLLLAASSPLGLANVAVIQMVVPLVFPDGRLPSRRWRPILWLVVSGILLAAVGSLSSEQIVFLGLPNTHRVDSAALRVAFPLGVAVLVVGTVAAIASLIDRYRHALPLTRVQIRWFGYAAALYGGLAIGILLVFGVTADPTILALGSAAHAVFPLAIMIAVLRYRLYDIDVLIRRTVVYGLTTGSIVVAFFAGIVVLQAMLRPFTEGNEIAVAASTLATLTLFQPIRSRIQDAVDRRFFRSRYDAARTLDAFSAQLRDEVNLEAVRADLVDAAQRTVQPAHASVWLRK